MFTLVLANFFDAMGTMTGLGKEAGLTDKDGNLPNVGKALVVEGAGAIVGGGASASSNTVFVESASGIAEGARTGLANVVTGVLFLVAMFLTPLYSVVPIEAAAPALVVVGALMIGQVRDIDFTDFAVRAAGVPDDRGHAVHLLDRQRHRRRIHHLGGPACGRRPASRTIHPLLWIVAALFVGVLRGRSDHRNAHLVASVAASGRQVTYCADAMISDTRALARRPVARRCASDASSAGDDAPIPRSR